MNSSDSNDAAAGWVGALSPRSMTMPEDSSRELWRIIWRAGGLCWIATSLVSLLWWHPLGGTFQDGAYIMTSGARVLHNVLMFLVSSCAYRIVLGQRWSTNPATRVRVVAVDVLVTILVLRLVPFLQILSAGLVEGDLLSMGKPLLPWLKLWLPEMFWLSLLRFWMPPYALGLATVALVYLARRYNRESMRLANLSAELANARMAMLSAQLHPHFLFNSLHAIAGLILENPPQAVTMVARLGDFLRVALESAKTPWARVSAEVEGLEAYLAVQQTRFRDRLKVQLAVDPNALGVPIPALLLQPIVENAIEHGRCGAGEALLVGVTIRTENSRLRVEVTNSTPRLPHVLGPESFGNGLRNVDARLHAAYAGTARMSIGPDGDSGTRAILDMPASAPGSPNASAHPAQ